MVDYPSPLLRYLSEELERRRLSRADLAAHSQEHGGPSKTAIYKWFTSGNISDENLRWLADAIGLDYHLLWFAKYRNKLPDNPGMLDDVIREARTEYALAPISTRALNAARQLDAMQPAVAEHFFELINHFAETDHTERVVVRSGG